ncbi:MAG: hypothetical protein ACLR23_25240 [Clostridia bacterium]
MLEIERRTGVQKEETRREQGTRRGKMNAGGGDRETSRRAKRGNEE